MNRKIILALVTSLVVSVLSGCGNTPESVVKGYYTDLGRGNLSSAKGALSKQILDMFPDAKVMALLAEQSKKITGCGGLKSITTNYEIQGELAKGTTAFEYNDCPSRKERISLIKENGAWKITH